jgi:regulatory protein YycI of two-component signal transduction system YycFG
MEALIFVLVLFVLAIVSPWIFANKTVSDHQKDIEKG